MNKHLITLIESFNDLEAAVNEYVKAGGRIRTVLWSDWWVDLGYPINVLEAIYYIKTFKEPTCPRVRR